MNTKQIIAELRRSAVCDDYPLTSCGQQAYNAAYEYAVGADGWYSPLIALSTNDLRTFYLLVAEALESK